MESNKNTCEAKMSFDTKKEAENTARVSLYKYGQEANLQVYKCNDCSLWHLATKY